MRVANSNFLNRSVLVKQPGQKPTLAIHEFNPATSSILAEWDAKLVRLKHVDSSQYNETNRFEECR